MKLTIEPTKHNRTQSNDWNSIVKRNRSSIKRLKVRSVIFDLFDWDSIAFVIRPVYRHVFTCKIEDGKIKALIYHSRQPIRISAVENTGCDKLASRTQSNPIPDDVNRTGLAIQPIKRNRTVEIRLSNAIESQSNGQIQAVVIDKIDYRLQSIDNRY